MIITTTGLTIAVKSCTTSCRVRALEEWAVSLAVTKLTTGMSFPNGSGLIYASAANLVTYARHADAKLMEFQSASSVLKMKKFHLSLNGRRDAVPHFCYRHDPQQEQSADHLSLSRLQHTCALLRTANTSSSRGAGAIFVAGKQGFRRPGNPGYLCPAVPRCTRRLTTAY